MKKTALILAAFLFVGVHARAASLFDITKTSGKPVIGGAMLMDENGNFLSTLPVSSSGSEANAVTVIANTTDFATEATLATMNAKFVSGTNIGAVEGTHTEAATTVGEKGFFIGGNDAAQTFRPLLTTNQGILAHGIATTSADGVANTLGLKLSTSGNSAQVETRPFVYNGTTWDMLRGDIANGLDVDVTRLPVGATPDHGAVTVGSSATLIVAADSTRSSVTIINAFTNLVAIGNSDVTLNTVAATDGFVLATSGAANDGSGGTLTLNTTAAIYGIGASASSKVIYFTEAE